MREEAATLHLRLPGLLGPLAQQPPAGVFPRLPVLEWLLARARLCAPALPDQLATPEGPLALLGCGGVPGERIWSRAEPVCLQAEGSGVRLVPAHLTLEERRALEQTVAECIGAHGLELQVHRPDDAWFIASAEHAPERPAPHRFLGRFVDGRTPRGRDALRWSAVLSELEMTLYDHPVSREREARGQAAPSTLWIWGSGRLDEAPETTPWRRIVSRDPAWWGLARHTGAAWQKEIPGDAGAWDSAPGCLLHEDDRAATALANGDGEAWLQVLVDWEERVLQSAVNGLRAGAWDEVTVDDGVHGRRVMPRDRWRFWCRSRPWQGQLRVGSQEGAE